MEMLLKIKAAALLKAEIRIFVMKIILNNKHFFKQPLLNNQYEERILGCSQGYNKESGCNPGCVGCTLSGIDKDKKAGGICIFFLKADNLCGQ